MSRHFLFLLLAHNHTLSSLSYTHPHFFRPYNHLLPRTQPLTHFLLHSLRRFSSKCLCYVSACVSVRKNDNVNFWANIFPRKYLLAFEQATLSRPHYTKSSKYRLYVQLFPPSHSCLQTLRRYRKKLERLKVKSNLSSYRAEWVEDSTLDGEGGTGFEPKKRKEFVADTIGQVFFSLVWKKAGCTTVYASNPSHGI